MRKIIFLGLVMFAVANVKAQSYIGFLSDNYSGVHGVIGNPANIADSRFKTDVNLVGASAFISNDYVGVGLSDLMGSDFDYDTDAELSASTNNNIAGNVDVLGPAFMFNLTPKSSIAVFSRARAFVTLSEINGETIDDLDDGIDENRDFMVDEGNFYGSASGWAEIGVTYAHVLYNKEQHFLKGGLSLKYLKGVGNVYTTGTDVQIAYDADGATLPDSSTVGTLTSTGEVAYGSSADFEDDDYEFEMPNNASGFGVDLGFVYEWRPDYKNYITTNADGTVHVQKDKNKYKLKVGLSVTDLGAVKYDDGVEDSYDITNSITEDDYEQYDGIEEKLENLYVLTSTEQGIKSSLPSALHFNVDYNINKGFYVNLNTDISLKSAGSNIVKRVNILSLTPRFESKWFSFYLPFSTYQYSGFQMGAGFRAGPLYVGSGSVITSLTKDKIQGSDVYLGLKVPVYQGSPKDKDEDGVIDKLDNCPKVPGPVENNGCPWEDTDGDTVMDNEDQCVNEAGPVENNGCPWGDTDGDTVLDNEDNCIDEAGPVENNGCPWPDTDQDGVLDKDDNCVDEVGTVANNGCPEPVVTEEVQKSLNEYAKTILFTSGKATLKDESTAVLVDIVKILKEYPNASFTVEGHTDSIGSVQTNQKLSEERAKSVMDFLVKNGIDSTRLTAVGYGESKPIATNMYKDGREKNRRVEINLVK
ncbi:OmpA family protein [Maribacter sp. MMG018]|uniref:DUF5723 family protein n=1 Tax=Maribacter sp. MMG018 TaxID=2822688 RepID=UPI001B37FFF8|nr:DUF5723 family protein [Maribacter sp. MMG018]MBQ4916049.1 OmpA family protein [Maribacter sp. MMG018]